MDIVDKNVFIKDSILYLDDGSVINSGKLANDYAIKIFGVEVVFVGGSVLYLLGGRFVGCGLLKKNVTFNVCGVDVEFKAGCYIDFNDKNVEWGYLVEDTVFRVGGVDYLFRGGGEIGFHYCGNVMLGVLANDYVVENEGYSAGDVIEFDSDGKLCMYVG